MKKLRYLLEALIVYILFSIFRVLSAEKASTLGGFIGRSIGPRLAMNRRVRRHLGIAFPKLGQHEVDKIVIGMWDNLGRVFAEYPHLRTLGHKAEIINADILKHHIEQKRPVIFIGAHIGNWEINAAALLNQYNQEVTLTYRPPNNPWVDTLIHKLRTFNGQIKAYPKSSAGGRKMMQTLKENGCLGILIDQKYNQGVLTDFFGAPAMTNPIFVQLAKKYNAAIIPVKCERVNKTHFRLVVHDEIRTKEENGRLKETDVIINECQKLLESWIEGKPEQWIWLHRRWGVAKYLKNHRSNRSKSMK